MYELLKEAKTGDKKALEELTRKNAGLVHSIAVRFENRGCDLEDLRQIGMIGLVKAIRRFDESYDVMFSTYAVPVITGEIKRFLRDDGMVKVSRRYKELSMAAASASRELSAIYMREPTLAEIADKLGVDIYTLTEATEACSPCDSIYRPVNNSDKSEMYLMDVLKDECDLISVDKISLSDAISRLNERERFVVAYRYFMYETQANVAKRLGISQVQVSRIEKKALINLKEMLRYES